MELSSSRSLVWLRLASAVAALLVLVQAILATLSLSKVAKLIGVHGIVGYGSLLLTIVAAVAAYLWYRRGGSRGLLMHAAGMAVIMIVQIGLGEVKALKWEHVGLGVLILAGSIALAVLAYRKPGGAS